MKIKFKQKGIIIDLDKFSHDKQKIVKVRKEHKCSDCGRSITVGEEAYFHSYSDGYRYHNTYLCSDEYEIVDDDAIGDPELLHCTCMEGNTHGKYTTSIAGCIVHGTIISYLISGLENKFMLCKTCKCSMAGVREDNFYEGKWYDEIDCSNPNCKDPESKHICKWWLDDDHKFKQELIDKEIQRRKDNNLPKGKVKL